MIWLNFTALKDKPTLNEIWGMEETQELMRRFVRNPKHREESNVRDEEKANSKEGQQQDDSNAKENSEEVRQEG